MTFRALAASLGTGAGAIYWHVADKRDLLAAAADHVVGLAIGTGGSEAESSAAIRAIALAMFDVLLGVAAGWARLDPTDYPFLCEIAARLPGHDDRAQYLAGIDLILGGIRDLKRGREGD